MSLYKAKNQTKKMSPDLSADVMIVGAGAAGIFAALTLAQEGQSSLILSNKTLGGVCASCWAQGGIAAAVDKTDNTDNHMQDTLKAGAGTSNPGIVKMLTTAAPDYMRILDKYGVQFDRDEITGAYRLSREACHGQRRVLKAISGDGFGRELMRALVEAVRQTPEITVVENVSAERLLRADGTTAGDVQGVLVRNLITGKMEVLAASAVLLATGGIGGLYADTTNPLGSVGRGLAMAARAGAVLSDLEFVQFHPTALDLGEDPAPLATEALRGEGAYLLNSRGERFMEDFHEMAELAPRDVVSRGIFAEMKKGQRVYLDCRHIDVSHFDALLAACARNGFNPQRDLLPVKPATHYHMGGIATDGKGRSSLNGLWACGEVAATGLHGANRLASNSLMEAIVMGGIAAQNMGDFVEKRTPPMGIDIAQTHELPKSDWVVEGRETLRHIMSDRLGVIRHDTEMMEALKSFADIEEMTSELDAETEDMALVARLVATLALIRTESRGGHCRSDFPVTKDEWKRRSFVTLKQANAYMDGLLETKKLNKTKEKVVA